MHTPLCRHALGEPIEYAARAVELGLTEIGFSDHSPMDRDDFDDWRMLSSELDQYVETVKLAQAKFPNLKIKLGLEVDYLPGAESWIRQLAGRHPWDYFIGSVHYVSESWDFDNPKKLSEWKKRDPFEVWTTYFERLTMAAESQLFDIIGHADLCKKFCYVPTQDCTHLYEKFLRAAASNDVAIEINTSGLRKDCKEIYPSPRIVELAADLKVPLTFGSDAHAPGEVGIDFEKGMELAKASGYTHWRRFTKRKSEEISLP
jgi:histidinol-phosphatase (PHP family)